MNDQAPDSDNLTLVSRQESPGDTKARMALLPVFRLVLVDEADQEWALTVRPDGQLQTAKYPDGEPMTAVQRVTRSILDAAAATDRSKLKGGERATLSFGVQVAQAILDEPE